MEKSVMYNFAIGCSFIKRSFVVKWTREPLCSQSYYIRISHTPLELELDLIISFIFVVFAADISIVVKVFDMFSTTLPMGKYSLTTDLFRLAFKTCLQ